MYDADPYDRDGVLDVDAELTVLPPQDPTRTTMARSSLLVVLADTSMALGEDTPHLAVINGNQ